MISADVSTCLLPDGRRLGWAEHGDSSGVPVVFLHGTPGGRLGGRVFQERYQRMGLRVITPERPGYGVSDPLPGRTVRTFADDLVVLLEALGLRRVFVAGGSGGGPHALALGAAASDRVRAVGVLCGAAPLLPDEIAEQLKINQEVFALAHDTAALRARLGPYRDAVLRDGIAELMKDAPESDRTLWAQHAELMNRAVSSALEPGVEGMVEDLHAVWSLPWGFAPADVHVPVVWGHGAADMNVPLAAAQRVAHQLPDCRFVTWEGVGHAPSAESMSEFFAALLARGL